MGLKERDQILKVINSLIKQTNNGAKQLAEGKVVKPGEGTIHKTSVLVGKSVLGEKV